MPERDHNAATVLRPREFILVRPAIALLVPLSIGICLAFRKVVISSVTEFLEFLYYTSGNNVYRTYALSKGIPMKQAMRCTNPAQVNALMQGIPLDQALKCTNYAQVYALEKNISLEQAMRCTNFAQVNALMQGIPLDQALLCTNFAQVYALENNRPLS